MSFGPLQRVARAHRLAVQRKAGERRAEPIARARAEAILRDAPRVPARAPIARWMPDRYAPDERWEEVQLNKRPDYRVLASRAVDPYSMSTRTVLFQAMEFGFDMRTPNGGTRFTWWGWTPQEEAHRSEVWRGLSRAAAYSERVRMAFDWLFGPRQERHPIDLRYPFRVNELREWIELVIEDVEQALGKP